MPTVHTIYSEDQTASRVAVIFEDGKIKPVWFATSPSSEQVRVLQITSTWSYPAGSAKILVFEIMTTSGHSQLKFNTQELTWQIGTTITE